MVEEASNSQANDNFSTWVAFDGMVDNFMILNILFFYMFLYWTFLMIDGHWKSKN